MLSHPESNSKQKSIIQKEHPQKRYSVTVVTVFGVCSTSPSLEVTYYIYKYIYKLNIILTN